MFLGSFENETITPPVVTEPLLEGLNPKSPSETDLLLYLGIHFDQYSLFLLQIFGKKSLFLAKYLHTIKIYGGYLQM